MGAREDQIKRLFIITKLRDELFYWCKINGKKTILCGQEKCKINRWMNGVLATFMHCQG